ncbi:MAG: phosphate acyltransferase PlsX [Clostridia bacterium]|nr:phosphate acyltransferase PlsX [Clostridia bacterium]
MIVIVDCMGGDKAPLEVVKGAYAASLEYNANFILVGDKAEILRIADEEEMDLRRFDIVDAPLTIEMTDPPLAVMKAKKDSSMNVALTMLAEGKGDALVSTGNTGALFTGATLIVRKIKGVKRAAIASILPMSPPVLLLDSGANITVTPAYLEQFAIMGSIYMHKIHGLSAPRVGLLNNGAEETKGTELQLEAYKLLSDSPALNFVGNVEANMVPKDACDVLVTDGFTGNVLLKSIEGMGKLMLRTMKDIFYSDTLAKISGLLIKRKINDIKAVFDPNEHGGAPILGISKPVIKAHGSSNAKAVKNAIRQAIAYADSGVIYSIARETKLFMPSHSPRSEEDKTLSASVREK